VPSPVCGPINRQSDLAPAHKLDVTQYTARAWPRGPAGRTDGGGVVVARLEDYLADSVHAK